MRENISADSVASEIRMARGSSFSGAFLIVEGEKSDLKLYGQFVDRKSCRIIPAHGKKNVIDALDILENDDFEGVLAIVDADFWRLEGIEPPGPNLFITDTHDLETMILKSPALEKLLTEFGSVTKIKELTQQLGKSVRDILLDGGVQIGYLRWISHKKKLSLKFEGIVFSKFISNGTLVINVANMIIEVQNKSQKWDPNKEDLQRAVEELTNSNHDIWDVCCGHDMVCILSLGLHRVLGTNKSNMVGSEVIEKNLRLAYEAAYFFGTELYKSLTAWEKANQSFKVFPES